MSSQDDRPQQFPGGRGGGPKGEAGERGETGQRGERGLPLLQGRAVIILFLIAAALGVFNLFWTSHSVGAAAAGQARTVQAQQKQAAAEQAKWCALIITLDDANAGAARKPSPGTFTAAFIAEIHQLRGALGCGT